MRALRARLQERVRAPMRALALCAALAGTALFAALAGAGAAAAQDFRGLTLGNPIPGDMAAPVGTQSAPPVTYTLWQFADGLSVSATTDAATGEVLYLEMWRTGSVGTQPMPVPGLDFGLTTRGDLAARYGSEGIVFENRGRFAELGPIAAYFISYEIADSDDVLSFVAIQPLADASEASADMAVVDSVIWADGRYLDRIWGPNRGRLAGYVPLPDPFAAE